jgi:hypothetical protein
VKTITKSIGQSIEIKKAPRRQCVVEPLDKH